MTNVLVDLLARLPDHVGERQLFWGKTFYCVGFNSSHEFYLAEGEDDTILKLSCGEEGWNEEGNYPIVGYSCRPVEPEALCKCYLGHW